ncbi:hypothetical protein AAC03nite_37820 [Alicyclobacillus acidoterrestris]|nr:hypothetical protein AAC03nite_37820 [Alicyclobacillus acidoterrestris]
MMMSKLYARISTLGPKNLHVEDGWMYRKRGNQLLLPHEFFLPFIGQLNEENRWVKLA